MTTVRRKTGCFGRRRFLTIAASAAGCHLLPLRAPAGEAQTFTWRGVVLGAEATLTLCHPDRAFAMLAIQESLKEVARLEAIFSLYQPDSAISTLNRDGMLTTTPMDLRILLSDALHLAERTKGAFDPTVQPLWALYADHFAGANPDPNGPRQAHIERSLDLVGWNYVSLEDNRVRFLKAGMAVTLNGIAQGYVTDKIGDLLRARGFESVLVNLGEQLALGPKPDGTPWRAGIQNPYFPRGLMAEVPLENCAMATSGGYGCSFDNAGNYSHLLDPRIGRPASRFASVTVLAPRATRADGLSTVLSLMPISDWRTVLGSSDRAFAVHSGAGSGYWV